MVQILSQVLELIPSPFSIRLAALASRHELVDLEKWLPDNLTTYKDIFFEVKKKKKQGMVAMSFYKLCYSYFF